MFKFNYKQNLYITGKPIKSLLGLFGALLLALVLLLALPDNSYAQNTGNDSNAQKKAYIILIDKLSIQDISPSITPNIYNMVQNGAMGLASSRTLRGQNNMDSSITIGSGNIARVYGSGIVAYNSNEPIIIEGKTAAQYYHNLTGYDPGISSVLLVNLPEVVVGLSEESVTTIPGALGENLRLNKLKAAVLGNSDYDGKLLRTAVTIGMDASGQVAYGDVGPDTVMYLPDRLLNHGTDYSYLQEKLPLMINAADLIIVELSDLARLEKADQAFPYLAYNEKVTCLSQIDQMVGSVMAEVVADRDLVLLLSPSPTSEQLALKNNFIPVVAYGADISPGSLSSGSTRRDFIIANTDIAPTILDFFGIEDELGSIIGVPMRVTPFQGDTLHTAAAISNSTSTTTRLRSLLVKSYVVLQIIFILLAVIAIFWIKSMRKIVQPLVLSLVIVPLVFLFLGKLPFSMDIYFIIAAPVLVILLTALFTIFFKSKMFYAFVAISGLTLLALNIDVLTGTTLIQSSVLGYDPMAGARYYGIGNEYMGIMLGSSIAVAVTIFERYSSKLVLAFIAVFFLFQCFIIGSPTMGAQSDGIITAPAAFLITLVLLFNLRLHWGVILAIIIVILTAIAGLFGYEMQKPAELQTHLGRAFSHVVDGDWEQIWTIITRKVNMNIKLIKYTIWSRVFLVMFVVLALLVFRPVGALKQLLKERPILVKGFIGIITGAVIGLIINDSGIVATSTTCIYLVIPLLLLMLEMQQESAENLPQIEENN